ncbi:hypothetical protein [Arenibacterium sp. CAU 1754]
MAIDFCVAEMQLHQLARQSLLQFSPTRRGRRFDEPSFVCVGTSQDQKNRI